MVEMTRLVRTNMNRPWKMNAESNKNFWENKFLSPIEEMRLQQTTGFDKLPQGLLRVLIPPPLSQAYHHNEWWTCGEYCRWRSRLLSQQCSIMVGICSRGKGKINGTSFSRELLNQHLIINSIQHVQQLSSLERTRERKAPWGFLELFPQTGM